MNHTLEEQLLHILNERCQLDDYTKRKLYSQEMGYRGEQAFQQILTACIPEHWRVLTDLTFHGANQRIQLDCIVIAPHCVFLFEIKNYQVEFHYRNGTLYGPNDIKIHDPFAQISRGEDILAPLLGGVPLISRNVYMSEHDIIHFGEACRDSYLKRWEVKAFLKNNLYGQKMLSPDKFAERLLPRTIPSHQGLEFECLEWVPQAKRGILCPQCFLEYTDKSRYKYICQNCNITESAEQALVRTICDYGIMHYQAPLRAYEIAEFCGPDVSYSWVLRTLNRHFERIPNPSQNIYVNPLQRLTYWDKIPKFRYKRRK